VKSTNLRVLRLCLALLAVMIVPWLRLAGQTPGRLRASAGTPSLPLVGASALTAAADNPQLRVRYMSLPLALEVNEGQIDSQVKFLARGQGYELLLTSNQAVLSLSRRASSPQGSRELKEALRTRLIGANPSPAMTAEEQLPGTSNYFMGSNPNNWRTNVPQYARVRYREIYPGIDLVYYGNQQQLEYDISVAPGADPNQVRFEVDGVWRLRVDRSGNLVLHSASGDVSWRKPVIYQESDGRKRLIAGRYHIYSRHEFGFELGDYDRSRILTIDPVLSYSTFIGGSLDDWFGWVTVDSAGNAYAVGMTQSTNFPTVNPLPTNTSYAGGAHDATIVKLNPTGTARLYSTYIGGNGDDWNRGVVVDSSGNAYVTGYTTSSNFPTVNPYQPAYSGGNDAFIAKIGPTGSTLLYSSYLGGTGDDFARGIAADNNGNAYIVGYTNSSSNFPIQGALQGAYGGGPYDAFVAKFNTNQPGVASLIYSTLLGDSGDDEGIAIAIDSSGNAYLAGSTTSTAFPTQTPYQPSNGGSNDVFVTEINSTDTALVFSTYLGGNGNDIAHGIAVDSTGIYVAGETGSTNFPTLKPVQATNGGQSDAFLTKFDPSGSSLLYSTYYGGSQNEYCLTLAVDQFGRAYLGGMTGSTNFRLVNPTQATYGGYNFDGFVVAFNSTGDQVLFATYFGGSSFDEIQGIAVDPSGNNLYIAGETFSPNLKVTPGVVQPTYDGRGDAFAAKIQLNFNAAVVSLSPGSLTFGSRALSSTSSGSNVQLTNMGTASLSINSVFASGNFGETDNCSGKTLLPSGSCTITVTFTPSVAGTVSGEITIQDSATGTPQLVNLSGTGVYPVTVLPASLSFGTVNVGGSSSPQTVMVSNNQSTAVNVSYSASGNYTAAPGSPNGCGGSLAGLGTCNISVTFTPTSTGSINGAMTVQHNANFSPMVVGLAGTGVTGPTLTFSPVLLDFGSIAVGAASAPGTVTVTNASGSAINISSLSASGNYSVAGSGATPCGGGLASGAHCTFNVTFAPSMTGAITGAISIADSAVGSPQIFSLAGNGVLPVSLSLASITFPTTAVGQTSGSVAVTLTNQTGTALTVSSITASGQYSVNPTGGSPCTNGSVVPALGACTFSVKFSPTSTGSVNGAITIIHNAAFSPQVLPVTGTGQ
jgi:Beta-propeller repeat/Abnormal spindle-like microcephaly-assoc'd, ASPM-SPD-2-Hydin/HYDIN/CFA65/VesB-like, Ig-like domain